MVAGAWIGRGVGTPPYERSDEFAVDGGASDAAAGQGAYIMRPYGGRAHHGGKIRHCRQLSLTLAGENCKIYAESSMARLRLGNRSGLSFQIETP